MTFTYYLQTRCSNRKTLQLMDTNVIPGSLRFFTLSHANFPKLENSSTHILTSWSSPPSQCNYLPFAIFGKIPYGISQNMSQSILHFGLNIFHSKGKDWVCIKRPTTVSLIHLLNTAVLYMNLASKTSACVSFCSSRSFSRINDS